MDRRCRFTFGTDVFECSLSARPWIPQDSTVGGSRVSSAGVPASYVVRRDALLSLALRIRESEWQDFLNLIVYGQSAQAFTWFPDALETTSFAVYLDSPAPGQAFEAARDQFERVFNVSIVLRGVAGAPPWTAYFS